MTVCVLESNKNHIEIILQFIKKSRNLNGYVFANDWPKKATNYPKKALILVGVYVILEATEHLLPKNRCIKE